MIIAGLDYSLTSPALCIGEAGASFHGCSCFAFAPSKKWIGNYPNVRLYEYPDWENKSHRYDILSEWVLHHLEEYEVDHLVIEGYSYGSKGRSVVDMGENGGILRWKLWNNKISYSEVAPSELKKMATGKGNANKEKMYFHFLEETDRDLIVELQKNGDKVGNPVSDIVDAYYLMKSKT